MTILVVGGGGREHTLVWKISQSELVKKIYCAPGNPGIAESAECVDIMPGDIRGLLTFAQKEKIDLTVVGPEDPLVGGIVDEFTQQGLTIFGPTQRAAELEGSKVFAKHLLEKYKIPTAACSVFDSFETAKEYLNTIRYPTVIKADGLAAGKGAIICDGAEMAVQALTSIMIGKSFGAAGNRVVIEEFMVGEEVSVLVFTDGMNALYLPAAQDHKAIFDHDEGPNTGGMGAYSPAPVLSSEMLSRVKNEIIEPTIRAMALEERPYRGVLYAGLMITQEGPKVVEFNCRFGDPEAQVVLPLMRDDIVELMFRIANGKEISSPLRLHAHWAMCIVLASGGYPGSYEKGRRILGLEKDLGEDIKVFHAGTRNGKGDSIETSGGRVLGITAMGKDYHETRDRAYWAVKKITFDQAYYRKDIGEKALKFLKK